MKNNKIIFSFIFGMVFLATIIVSSLMFFNTVSNELEESLEENLKDMASQQQLAINMHLESMIYSLVSMAEALPIIGVDESEILAYIEEKQEELSLQTILVIDVNGIAYLSNGTLSNVAHNAFYKIALAGESYATEPYISEYSGEEVFTVSVPIYVEDKIDGVLAVEYSTEYMHTILTSFTDERGLSLILNSDSNILVNSSNLNITFDAFQSAQFNNGASFDSIVTDFKLGNSGSVSYTIGGVKKYGEYRPIMVNDWILFFEISEENLTESYEAITQQMIINTIIVILFAIIIVFYVISSKNEDAKKLEKAAYYDELTGIPNLLKFKLMVSDILKKNANENFTMIKMDIVDFKVINEMFGYDAGNIVINCIAQTGKTAEKKNKKFIQARISNEEFMLFANSDFFENLAQTAKVYEQHFKSLLPEFSEHQFAFRYGRYYIKPGETDINDIVNKTNIAHSHAKKNRIANIWDYDEEFRLKVLKDTQIANKMHKALENEEFKVYLQPKYSLNNTKIVGAEALVRWVQYDGAMVFPNDFIPLFEQNGFIVQLDKYMLSQVCRLLKKWQDMNIKLVPISVNFARLHLQNKNFVNEIQNIVSQYGINTKYIEIELTESTVIENEKQLKKLIKQLHKAGFLVSIDDFGSGYSSLGMLKTFDVDTLKLDRSFFIEDEDEHEQHKGELVIKSIIELANSIGMYTVAEGIENEKQKNFLNAINCSAAQGYYFSKPVPISDFENLYFEE